jgi:centromeric protein E
VDENMRDGNRDSKLKEGKGNVIVSVRVRPDGPGEQGKTTGEWMVDGRRSLVAYRGREGGDYYYGECICLTRLTITNG